MPTTRFSFCCLALSLMLGVGCVHRDPVSSRTSALTADQADGGATAVCLFPPLDADPGEANCLLDAGLSQTDTDGQGQGEGVSDAVECLGVTCAAIDACAGPGSCDQQDEKIGSCADSSLADEDAGGVCDALDGCPEDPEKTTPGRCGCGAPETDSDGDATPDCVDACPDDAGKILSGVCGCGIADADSDGDGTADCNDVCPLDAAKTSPGACGCARSDADTDQDGVVDCEDDCPVDPGKRAAGECGCGVSDRDGDLDGTPDCRDGCPEDRAKIAPGVCGCGTADVDVDGGGDGGARCGASDAAAPAVVPSFVDITWMSISNVHYALGPLGILTDGYITRIPLGNFFGGAGGLAFTRAPNKPDAVAVSRVLEALGGPSQVNLLLTGHSHFDHAFDTATWSALTGAPIIGSKTTCFQAVAQAVPADHCTVVVGGETIALSEGVTMRVVRWNHSGSAGSNPEQHNAIELDTVPVPDPTTGGLHAGVSEDFPNGGGGRAFLFTVAGSDARFSWFFQNSASATDLAVPIVIDGVNYGAPIDNLRKAMTEAGIDSVDLWIGTGGASVAQLVLPIIKPKAYLPVHWDGLDAPFLAGVPRRYSDSGLTSLLSRSGVKLLTPVQYMDKWRLDQNGVQPVANTEVKRALGFSN